MTVLKTIEVRWFFDALPFPVEDYFQDRHLAPVRTDWYAVPSDEACGVKTREGRLETKLRAETIGLRSFATATGIVESWSKWSFELPHADPPSEEVLKNANWVAVEKLRYIIRYEITDGSFEDVAHVPTNGCSFELTEVTVDNQISWTVGLEAVGAVDQLETNLASTFEILIAKKPFPDIFHVENSYGYPKWLNLSRSRPG